MTKLLAGYSLIHLSNSFGLSVRNFAGTARFELKKTKSLRVW